ncbi:hypothetical protein SpCBS45565_g01052 [Spizellomyces sp. 'palustris']|nr:hypothetical protein SpCBS45565_g01052 [Spizellomyces sp. 'palustris']
MAVDLEEGAEALEYVGNFETDYHDACRRNGAKPFNILKIRHPLPPLPISMTPRPLSGASGQDKPSDGQSQPGATEGDVTVDGVLTRPFPDRAEENMAAEKDEEGKFSESKIMTYNSRYRFTPTIVLETIDGDDDDEPQKLEVRGWKLPYGIIEVLSGVIPACGTITNLILWNCGLDETHFSLLLTTVLSANIRVLSLDRNPLIPEHLWPYLITEESSVRSLSLRSNNIGDAGLKGLAEQLKSNRVLVSLSLWNNKITKEGAEHLAEALKLNQSLTSLSLGLNNIGDEGAVALAKVLANSPLLHDELLASRRKAMAEMDKQRKDQEEDPIVKKAKGRMPTAATGRNNSAKVKSEESIIAGGIKKESIADLKAKRPIKGSKKEEGGSAGGSKGGATQPNIGKQKSTTEVGVAAQPPGPKKAATAGAVVVEEKGAASKGKEKKGAVAAKSGKKSKAEETKEEVEEAPDSNPTVEPMFEHNGQWFVLGNRTLNNLNLFRNNIREEGLKALLDAVTDQEITTENTPDAPIGLFRLTLTDNAFDADDPAYKQLISILNSRNPYYENAEGEGVVRIAQEGNDSDKGETTSDAGT